MLELPKIEISIGGRKYDGMTLRSIMMIHRSEFRRYLNTRDTNSVFRDAMIKGGELWILVFLPKRKDMGYAKTYLGYSAGKKYEAAKIGWAADGSAESPQPTPFVLTGESWRTVLGSVKPYASVTAGHAVLRVKFRLGKIAFKKSEEFTTLPVHEYRRVTQEVERILRKELMPQVMRTGRYNPNDAVRPLWGNERYASGTIERPSHG
jgi:hypothetical protein